VDSPSPKGKLFVHPVGVHDVRASTLEHHIFSAPSQRGGNKLILSHTPHLIFRKLIP